VVVALRGVVWLAMSRSTLHRSKGGERAKLKLIDKDFELRNFIPTLLKIDSDSRQFSRTVIGYPSHPVHGSAGVSTFRSSFGIKENLSKAKKTIGESEGYRNWVELTRRRMAVDLEGLSQ